MSVTSTVQKSGRTFQRNDSPAMSGTKEYYVYCSDKLDTPDTAADSLPRIGASWSATYPGLVVKSVSVDEYNRTAAGGVIYLGKIDYSTRTTDPNKQDPDPTKRDCELRLSFENSSEPISLQKDSVPVATFADGSAQTITTHWTAKKYGASIVNSVGVPYDVREDVATMAFTFTKNLETNDWAQVSEALKTHVNTVNQDAFSILYRGVRKTFAAHTCYLVRPSSEPMWENEVAYEKITVTILVRDDGWQTKLLDQGYAAFKDSTAANAVGGLPAEIRDDNDDPLSQPAMLDGNGLQLLDVSMPVFLSFRLKGYTKFQEIGFDEWGPA